MRGKQVFYPVGWDDNGLPTERRAQNYYGVTCDPALPYQPGLVPPVTGGGTTAGAPARAGPRRPVSRRNFMELCRQLTEADERAYEQAWRRIGLSVDWSTSYRTIDARSAAVSQRAFLRNLARGEAYAAEAPVLWDVTFGTAVAQAEIEDREVPGTFWTLAFRRTGAGAAGGSRAAELTVATTRPELLPACVALVAHPGDKRYAGLPGTSATVPLFGTAVPILAYRLADPAKGTGLAMVCTFGDITDLTWWRDLRLETRPVIGPDGRLQSDPPPGITGPAAAAYGQLAGRTAGGARQRVAELLRAGGHLRGDPRPVRHSVKFYEKGELPLEIITTRQWYLRNGGTDPGLREELLTAGRQLSWHPPHMRARYENWVRALTGDWLVSRQRYFGVPIPLWYRLDEQGQPCHDALMLPEEGSLPVDPAADVPPGFRPQQRDVPGGFTADPDVMDTWATSSLSPQIAGAWGTDDELFGRVFPMDLRPQAHEIIRTWLFYTVLRSGAEHGALPWRHVAISGWILDPHRKKMSKSAGNVMTPMGLLAEYGADAVRYWAASARLGADTSFDPAQLEIGRRLAVKVLNASRFVLGMDPAVPAAPVCAPLDTAMLGRLAGVVARCTEALDGYDHALALELAEQFFWLFCDDYLELVKPRSYGELGEAGAGSAVAALRLALSVLLRLLAPFLPFVTEEAWSWSAGPGQPGSIHRAGWPEAAGLRALGGPDGPALQAASAAIAAIRKAKSQARLPMKAPVRRLAVTGPARQLDALAAVLGDVRAAGRVSAVDPAAGGDELRLEVTLSGAPAGSG